MKNSGTYLMFERLMVIQNLIREGNFPTLEQLQQCIKDRLGAEVSKATLARDLEFLRSRAGCPVSYSRQERGYFLETNGGSL